MGKRRRRSGRGGRFFTGEPDGLQPGDDIGNRRKRAQGTHPPDDIGNRRPPEESLRLPADDVGNRVEASPTHEVSGVLSEVSGRRRRRKGAGQPVRIGRYIVGGVNPLVAGNTARAMKAHEEYTEKKHKARDEERGERSRRRKGGGDDTGRRARFFDFEEDDRFHYQLSSDPALKQREAGDAVDNVLKHAGRDAEVSAHLIEDGARPKVLVTIDEKGDDEALFGLESPALMSLNYLVNKIVNRYPDDRIRLAILPASDEQTWRDSLAAHRAKAPDEDAVEAQATQAASAPRKKKAARKKAAAPRKPAEEVERVSIGAFDLPRAGAADTAPPAKKRAAKKAAKKAPKKTAKKAAKKAVKKAVKTASEAAAVDPADDGET